MKFPALLNEAEAASGPHLKGLGGAILKSYEQAAYSDLTIMCRGRTYKVHKLVICAQSRPLAAAVNGAWIESQSSVIKLVDEEPQTVEDVLNFLYKGELFDVDEDFGGDIVRGRKLFDDRLLRCVKLYIFGDKWKMPTIQKAVMKTFDHGEVVTDWTVETFIKAVYIIWEGIPKTEDPLKLILVHLMIPWMPHLIEEEVARRELFGHPEIIEAVLRDLMRRRTRETAWYR